MRRNRGGFTIIEVMIFLAISGAMLAAAIIAINGQQNRTEFTQAMRDIDSKLQDTLNDVSTGNYTYGRVCSVNPGLQKPQLTGPQSSDTTKLGTQSECLFLGEALQFSTRADNNDKFYSYTVLGRRLKPGGTPGSQVSVNSFDEANPTAMIGGSHDLSSFYTFENGITTSKITYTPPGGLTTVDRYSLIGLYTNFNSAAGLANNSSSDAAQSLQAFIYRLPAASYYDSAATAQCIDANNSTDLTCPFEQSFGGLGSNNGLKICFLSNNGTSQTAMITIYNTAAGVNTRLDYNPEPSGVCPTS